MQAMDTNWRPRDAMLTWCDGLCTRSTHWYTKWCLRVPGELLLPSWLWLEVWATQSPGPSGWAQEIEGFNLCNTVSNLRSDKCYCRIKKQSRSIVDTSGLNNEQLKATWTLMTRNKKSIKSYTLAVPLTTMGVWLLRSTMRDMDFIYSVGLYPKIWQYIFCRLCNFSKELPVNGHAANHRRTLSFSLFFLPWRPGQLISHRALSFCKFSSPLDLYYFSPSYTSWLCPLKRTT